MRDTDSHHGVLFSYFSPEARVPKRYPLCSTGEMLNGVLGRLPEQFEALDSPTGLPSISPKQSLRTTLPQILYDLRREPLPFEQADCNLLIRWFIGLSLAGSVRKDSTFSKQRDRLLEARTAREPSQAVLARARPEQLLSKQPFTVDGMPIVACATATTFRPRDNSGNPSGSGRNGDRELHGERRRNETRTSVFEPHCTNHGCLARQHPPVAAVALRADTRLPSSYPIHGPHRPRLDTYGRAITAFLLRRPRRITLLGPLHSDSARLGSAPSAAN